jgi:hypothetical protein
MVRLRLTLIRPLRGHLLPQAGEGFFAPLRKSVNVDEGLDAPSLPLAGESWGEGERRRSKKSARL